MLAVLVAKIVRKDVPWRLVAAFGGIGFVLALLSGLNELPLTLFEYDTASPLSGYLTRQVVLGVLGAIATGAGIALVVAAAEPIYRERFPRQASLGGAFSLRGIQTKGFFRSSCWATRWPRSSSRTRRSSTSSPSASARGPRPTCRTATC